MTDDKIASPKPERKRDLVLPSPHAMYIGELDLGGIMVDVYVLDTKDRVLSLRGAMKALTGIDGAPLSDYLSVKALQPYLVPAKTAEENEGSKGVTVLKNKAKTAEENPSFFIDGTGWANGITAERFEMIITAYVAAFAAGALRTDRQREIAMRCAAMSTAFLRVGIIAAIDEATGYQHVRAKNDLQIKVAAYISEDLRPWVKLFPDELWMEFARLTGRSGPVHKRPRYWGHLVNKWIYDTLDPELAKWIRENKPKPSAGVSYHQWFSEDFGVKALLLHIQRIIGIAQSCDSKWEMRDKIARIFGTEPAQMTMYLPNPNRGK